MALLEILEYPDPRLRTVAVRIDKVDDALRTLALDMIETMYEAPGIGLAASQINVHRRLVVIDVSEQQDAPLILINPEYVVTGAPMEYQEGCLSVPGYYENVTRFDKIQVSALNEQGEALAFEATDLLAICIQHEIDHLDGKLFVDYLTSLKRTRIKKKLEKQHKLDH